MHDNAFRPQYRQLDDKEIALVSDIKSTAGVLYEVIKAVKDQRAQALAKTKLEEVVMWAVKGVTG